MLLEKKTWILAIILMYYFKFFICFLRKQICFIKTSPINMRKNKVLRRESEERVANGFSKDTFNCEFRSYLQINLVSYPSRQK